MAPDPSVSKASKAFFNAARLSVLLSGLLELLGGGEVGGEDGVEDEARLARAAAMRLTLGRRAPKRLGMVLYPLGELGDAE